MKKTAGRALLLVFTLFIAFNVFLNIELRPLVNKYAPGADYAMACSVIPDRVALIGFSYGNMEAPFIMADFNLKNILNKRYDRFLDGVAAYGLKMRFVKKPGVQPPQDTGVEPFIMPFCKYIYVMNSSIEYEDIGRKYRFYISGINGKSVYRGKQHSTEYMTLESAGYILGKAGQKVYLKLDLYPYYTNRFFLNVFATAINPKIFEPMFRGNNIKFDSGRVDFILQMKGEMRKICVNNIVRFERVKIRENTGLDLKALFGVSVEQLTDFLKDSNGDFFINFTFNINDSDLGNVFRYYGDAFESSVTDRVRLGIITAPVRQIKDLIWNMTGENVVRFFKMFGGN
jgi:hypothetical protein